MTEHKSLRLEESEGVAEVVLIGPGKGNAMGPDFWKEMPDVMAALDRDEEVRAIIVRGEGNSFSYETRSGGDDGRSWKSLRRRREPRR